MWQAIAGILIQKIIDAVVEAASDYLKFRKMSADDKKKVMVIASDPDPRKRAERMRDFLNT